VSFPPQDPYPGQDCCDCGHPVSYHHDDPSVMSIAGPQPVRCGWNPPKSQMHCNCREVTKTGVARDMRYVKS